MKKISQVLNHLIPLVFLILGTISVSAQTITTNEIDSLVERILKTFDVPGIAVAIIKDDRVIHSKGYGVRSLNTKQKVDSNTLFGIASNSKAFTTAALGKNMQSLKHIAQQRYFSMFNKTSKDSII